MKTLIFFATATLAFSDPRIATAYDPHTGRLFQEPPAESKFLAAMFIHWGLYAVPAGFYEVKPIKGIGEWITKNAKIPVATYAGYAKTFNPTGYDAEKWVNGQGCRDEIHRRTTRQAKTESPGR